MRMLRGNINFFLHNDTKVNKNSASDYMKLRHFNKS